MKTLTTDEVIKAWTGQYGEMTEELEEMIEQDMKLTSIFLQILSEGRPVSAARLAEEMNMPVEQVEAIYEQYAAHGGEFDEDGNLVGAALTLNPTPHHFRVKGNDLYAWCSLDTIFLPGLIGETAVVDSKDPVSGEPIHLTITPHGVKEYSPSSTVLSITIPGLSCRTENSSGPHTGPQSEACSQMHFFISRGTAETWLKDRPGITIFTVEEAWQLAKENWLDRRKATASASL